MMTLIAITGWVLAAFGWGGFVLTQWMLNRSMDNFDALARLTNDRSGEEDDE